MHITAQGPRLGNDLYCVEWDVKLYYAIPYHNGVVCGGGGKGTAYEGRKIGILAFALQCISVSLYLFLIFLIFLIYPVHRGWVLPVGGAARRTFAPGGKNPRAASDRMHCFGLMQLEEMTCESCDSVIASVLIV